MMTGGVAKNIGVVRAIEEKLGVTIYVPKEPEICGALGAALIAMEDIMNES
jgi:activator of 2-hydroxyglutaryl-CoA dehydratase